MAQSIPLVEFGLDPLTDLNFLKVSFGQRWIRPIENLSRTSLVLMRGSAEAEPGEQTLLAELTDL